MEKRMQWMLLLLVLLLLLIARIHPPILSLLLAWDTAGCWNFITSLSLSLTTHFFSPPSVHQVFLFVRGISPSAIVSLHSPDIQIHSPSNHPTHSHSDTNTLTFFNRLKEGRWENRKTLPSQIALSFFPILPLAIISFPFPTSPIPCTSTSWVTSGRSDSVKLIQQIPPAVSSRHLQLLPLLPPLIGSFPPKSRSA